MSKQCVARHTGVWCVEPRWFAATWAAIRGGQYRQLDLEDAVSQSTPPVRVTEDGIAVVGVEGMLMKGSSKFGNVDSVALRGALRQLAGQDAVRAIVLHIDSPGGTFAGTDELASDIAAVNAVTPVVVHIEDMGASAAYYAASQASAIYASPASEVGSIGTYAVVEDTSGAAEASGVKVHVVASGPHKGTLADGVPVTEEVLADVQKRVHEINGFFLRAVERGRGMSAKDVAAVADGRTWMAADAKGLGLIDGVQRFDDTINQIRDGWRAKASERRLKHRIAAARLRQR